MTSSTESHTPSRNKAILEVLIELFLIFGYTWFVHPRYPSALHIVFFICILGLIVFSKQSRNESFRDLGIRIDNIGPSLKFLLLPTVLGIVLLSVVWSLIFPVDPEFYLKTAFWEKLIRYPFWALFQQYIALAFFFKRLRDILYPSVFPAVFCVAVIFSASHIPNPPLMILTFLGGLFWAWAYHRHTNLLTIAVCHGIIGAILVKFLLVYTIVGPFADIARWTHVSPTAYSLDSINGTRPQGKSPKIDMKIGDKKMVIYGWAKGIEGDIEKIFISFQGKDYPVQYGNERKDVATYYDDNNYLHTGFRSDIPISHLKSGIYPLRVKIKLSNRSTFHYPGTRVWVRVR
jgi:membrane protease YdiL (CAAX protease family)